MRRLVYFVIIPLFLFFPILRGEPVLTLFYAPYPGASPEALDFIKHLKQPKHLARHVLENSTNSLITHGIISSYAGYIEVSDVNGQTIFPRKHVNPIFYIVVTPQATPFVMNANTINHWEREPNIPFVTYKMTQETDEETGLTYWNTQESPLPDGKILPLESIIIFAKPKYVYVPTGITITPKGENFILPTIYIKKGIDVSKQALYFMNLGLYFRPLTTLYMKKDLQYSTAPAA